MARKCNKKTIDTCQLRFPHIKLKMDINNNYYDKDTTGTKLLSVVKIDYYLSKTDFFKECKRWRTSYMNREAVEKLCTFMKNRKLSNICST